MGKLATGPRPFDVEAMLWVFSNLSKFSFPINMPTALVGALSVTLDIHQDGWLQRWWKSVGLRPLILGVFPCVYWFNPSRKFNNLLDPCYPIDEYNEVHFRWPNLWWDFPMGLWTAATSQAVGLAVSFSFKEFFTWQGLLAHADAGLHDRIQQF